MGSWIDDFGVWNNCGLGEDVQSWNASLVHNFYDVLESAALSQFGHDTVTWLPDVQSGYSVHSGMALFASHRNGFALNVSSSEALDLVWNFVVPFSIKVFGWRGILNRLPSKDLLIRRGINLQQQDRNCVLCKTKSESLFHLLFHCYLIKKVWTDLANWTSIDLEVPFQVADSLLYWSQACGGEKVKRSKRCLIWLAATWVI
ncbi:uncharacterized protein LOC131631700 [Vicia villosa]|uniref:uncharacterized protein LOC131631700 n=1 Tax=Vicia villosa TaxID=3911 RepID=UPI00273CD02E|nr:uncharacterized protein LOC131631700 [Vicia villosa]